MQCLIINESLSKVLPNFQLCCTSNSTALKISKIILVVLLVVYISFQAKSQLQQQSTNQIFASIHAPTQSDRRQLATRAVTSPIPRIGDQKLLVLLVDFPDRPGLFTGTDWQNFFFGEKYSFTTYYNEVSYGKLRYSGDIIGIQPDGSTVVTNSPNVAYIRLPNPLTYYANGNHGFNFSSFPKNVEGVVYHALQQLDNIGFDFAPFAAETVSVSKRVRNVVVVSAGSDYRYTGDSINSLGSTAFKISWSHSTAFITNDGQYFVDDFTFCPDQYGSYTGKIAHIGTCVHEQGHSLGMYDLYDVTSKTIGGVGMYDVMSHGMYASNGLVPFHFGAFSKTFFNWIRPITTPNGTTRYTLPPSESSDAQIIKLYPRGDTKSLEYFLVENRQPIGYDQAWTTRDLCPGIFIWHIDQNITTNYPGAVNSQIGYDNGDGPAHRGVIILEADGKNEMTTSKSKYSNYGDCSDRWNIGRTWNDTSKPNARTWNDNPSGLSLTVVSQSGSSIDVIVSVTNPCLSNSTPSSPQLQNPKNRLRIWTRRSVTL